MDKIVADAGCGKAIRAPTIFILINFNLKMARQDSEIRITPSIYDRLLDFEPDVKREAPKSRAQSLRELKIAVRRDLESLLNTRCMIDHIPERLEEVNSSLAIYGLPDITGVAIKSMSEQHRLVGLMKTAIRVFEPRLMNVEISLEPISDVQRILRFRIDAQLKVDPIPEPITFDTVLQMGSGEFEVVEK